MQISIGSRTGKVHRIVASARYVDGLNGEFLDVKARFAHDFINHKDRIKTPLIRYSKGGKLIPAMWDDAIKFIAKRLAEANGSIGVIASPRLTNESIFALGRFAEQAGGKAAVSDRGDMSAFFANLSAPLATHKDIRYAKTILMIGGEPEEEQTFTAKQIRQAVRNGGAKLIVVNERAIRMTTKAAHFVHANPGSYEAFVLYLFGQMDQSAAAEKLGIDAAQLDGVRETLEATDGDFVIVAGWELSRETQAMIAGSAGMFASDAGRVLLHPLPLYNNSVGAIDVLRPAMSVAEVAATSKALLIGGSLQDPSVLAGKEFVVVQEMFETETTAHADVVLPAASFAEMDGTYTNNAGNVQRVRKAIEAVHQSKPDWMITAAIAREMGMDLGFEASASGVFRTLADSVAPYSGLRYPMMKDESEPVQAKHETAQRGLAGIVEGMKKHLDELQPAEKITEVKHIGHKLHRLTTMTSKTAQFHLLAQGNPKPESLLVSPLAQFGLNGGGEKELAASVGVKDRV